jgi:hypothetical protein
MLLAHIEVRFGGRYFRGVLVLRGWMNESLANSVPPCHPQRVRRLRGGGVNKV